MAKAREMAHHERVTLRKTAVVIGVRTVAVAAESRGWGIAMNLYRVLGEQIGTQAARDLAERLLAWHDAMVAHERRLQNRLDGECADHCPHIDARSLWAEAVDTFGQRAEELVFLARHGAGRAQAVGQ